MFCGETVSPLFSIHFQAFLLLYGIVQLSVVTVRCDEAPSLCKVISKSVKLHKKLQKWVGARHGICFLKDFFLKRSSLVSSGLQDYIHLSSGYPSYLKTQGKGHLNCYFPQETARMSWRKIWLQEYHHHAKFVGSILPFLVLWSIVPLKMVV